MSALPVDVLDPPPLAPVGSEGELATGFASIGYDYEEGYPFEYTDPWTWGPVFYPDWRRRRPIFLSGAINPRLAELEDAGWDVGFLTQPGNANHKRHEQYRMWAADNGRFGDHIKGKPWDADAANRWLQWLNTLPRPNIRRGNCHEQREWRAWMTPQMEPPEVESFGCLFATAPDIPFAPMADSWRVSEVWLETIKLLGFPVALVAQDGCEDHVPTWDEEQRWDALLIGGSDAWKDSEAALDCIREARVHDKWVHVGRVNTPRRFETAIAAGADSVDGNLLAFGPYANIPKVRQMLRTAETQAALF